MSDAWLVVGLGNPGPEYARTRHNVGQMVLDELASRLGGTFKVHKTRAQVLESRLRPGGPRVVLAKPMTYMNTSGGPVAGLAKFYGIPAERVIAVHDEIDIPFAALKLKIGGGEGGHNGLRDMSKALSTKDYYRVRVGVGRPPGRMDAASYVLKPFSSTEGKELPFLLDDAADAVEHLVDHGLLEAQQRFHGR
ncbi:aminoacyl-tRNA hydrolase [Kocuria rosea]|uniref:aminoacyl-tRNA hydrolase n=1 Tax=Kocuria rosea TaxID=1275 RepID=UPI0025B79031|nr:aminoacyl-tRNA hydrolase [Kocuria rosea]WJZ65504.1 aminoacyl-tRNA hydrolase [Kocuria rosea]